MFQTVRFRAATRTLLPLALFTGGAFACAQNPAPAPAKPAPVPAGSPASSPASRPASRPAPSSAKPSAAQPVARPTRSVPQPAPQSSERPREAEPRPVEPVQNANPYRAQQPSTPPRNAAPQNAAPQDDAPRTAAPITRQPPPAPGRPMLYSPTPGNPALPMAGSSANRLGLPQAQPADVRTVTTAGGNVTLRANGRPAEVRDNRTGMQIHHELTGGQRIVAVNPGGGRITIEKGRPAYIARSYVARGATFERRTYYGQGQPYDRYFRRYPFHHRLLEVYVPTRYYPVAYYGWVYRPWPFPVHYGWRWRSARWYSYFGGYFAPYPAYDSADLWLTDYLFAESLDEAYAQQQADGSVDSAYAYPSSPMSPDVKQMVADEVQGELAIEGVEASTEQQQQIPDPATSSIAVLLSDGRPHAFVAGRELDVVDGSGRECAITEGDVVELTTPPGPYDSAASVQVLSSKGGADCPVRDSVGISLDDLQEMQNHMRATIDQGLAQLQSEQGRNGLPPAPAAAIAPATPALEAQNAPPPDANGAQEIAEQTQLAQATDQQLTAQATAAPAGGTLPVVSLNLGQSFAEVTAVLGQPTQVIQLGQKTIYVYPSTKVTFINGQVSDIQ